MNRAQLLRTDDIRRLLEVKDFNKKAKVKRADSVNSDDSDLSTKSMPQYSSYRTLSGGLFGPFEKSPSRPGSRTGFLNIGRRGSKTPEMSHIPGPSRIKTPSVARPRGTGEGSSRPSSRSGSCVEDGQVGTPLRPAMSRENSASKLPVFRRESSMPQIKREPSIPKIRREVSDIRTRPSSTPRAPVQATPRGKNAPIVTQNTPKTVAERKVSEKNVSARGTRSGISGISLAVMIGDRVSINGTDKKGIVQFVGETRFAKGVWAGVVLDDKTGKNDGSVAGVRYFTCPALRGVFVKEEKLEKISDVRDKGFTAHGTAADRPPSGIRKDSAARNNSSMSTDSGVEEEHELTIGDSVKIMSASGSREGTLRFVGLTEFAKGTWCGVELKEPMGKNDGAVAGTRYFKCEAKHGLFAQISKVKKIASSSSEETASPRTPVAPSPVEQINTSASPDLGTITPSPSIDSETESALRAVEDALAHEDILSPTPSLESSTISVNDTHVAELNTKIAALQLQLHKQDEELKSSYAEQEKEKLRRKSSSENNDRNEKVLLEHQENTLRFQGQVSALEREKLNLQNELNDGKQKIEDLQFQLEEQLLMADDKGPSNEDLEKVLGLEAQLKEKEKEISTLQGKLDKSKAQNEEEVFRLNEKDIQMEGKDKEVEKLGELLTVTKDNETLLNTEVANLKQQIQDLRDLQSSVSDAENKGENIRNEFEKKLLERDRKVTDMQDELQNLQNKISRLQIDLNERDAKVADLEFQLGKNREDLNETVESKGALNKQILELNNELNEKRTEIQSIGASTETLKHENLDIKAKLEASESRNSQLIQDKKKLEEDVLKVSKNSGDNAQQLVYLNEQIQSKNSDIASLQDKTSTLTAENHKLIQELSDYKDKVAKEKASYEKEKTEENQKLRDSITVMEDHFKKIKIKNEEIEQTAQKEKLELQKSSNELVSLNEVNKTKDDKLAATENELQQSKTKMEELSKSLGNQLGELDAARKELSIKSNELEASKTETHKIKTENNSIKEQNSNITEELTNLKIERTNLEKRLNCMTQEKDAFSKEKDTVSKTHDDVILKIEHMNKEKEQLLAQNKNLEHEKLELTNKCSKLSEGLKSSTSYAQKYQEELTNYEQQILAGSSIMETLQAELTAAKTNIQNTHEKYKALETEKENLLTGKLNVDAQNEKLQADLQQKTQQEQGINKETQLLRDQLKQAIDREQTLRTKLDADSIQLKTQIESSISSIKSMDNEINTLRMKVKELEEKNTSLENNKNKPITNGHSTVSSLEYDRLKEEIEQIKSTRDEKTQEVNFLNTIIVDLQKKNKEKEDRIQILTYGDDVEDDTSGVNDTMSPVKPGLRMRSFCDICDKFDLHDTEDCPTQSSDTGGSQHHGERGTDRPYCVGCETFGHTVENCDDEEKKSNLKTKKHKRWLKRHMISWKQSL